jgi:hypothetical protein
LATAARRSGGSYGSDASAVVAAHLLILLTGAWFARRRSPTTASPAFTFVTHHTNLTFITAAAGAVLFPTGALSPGDLMVVSDDLLQCGGTIGYDNGLYTMTYAANVLCDFAVTLTNQGEVHVSYTFQWPPSANSAGPSAFDGVIDGGTLAFQDAHGSFHAVALLNGQYQFTATIADPREPLVVVSNARCGDRGPANILESGPAEAPHTAHRRAARELAQVRGPAQQGRRCAVPKSGVKPRQR